MNYSSLIPSLVCAIVVFAILALNPSWLQGKQYGDKPAKGPDPLIASIIVFLAGVITVYVANPKSQLLGSMRHRY